MGLDAFLPVEMSAHFRTVVNCFSRVNTKVEAVVPFSYQIGFYVS